MQIIYNSVCLQTTKPGRLSSHCCVAIYTNDERFSVVTTQYINKMCELFCILVLKEGNTERP